MPGPLAFEACVTLLEGGFALVVVHAIAGGTTLASPRGWLAAFVAAIGVDLIRGVLIELAMLAVGAPSTPGQRRSDFGFGLAMATTSTSLALIIITLASWGPGAVWLVSVPAGVVAIGYRAYTRLLPRQDSLQFLYDTAQLLQEVQGTDQSGRSVAKVLDMACGLLRAERVVLLLYPDGGRPPTIVAQGGPEGGGPAQLALTGWRPFWLPVVEAGAAALVPVVEPDDQGARLVPGGVRHAMVAPLKVDGRGRAALVVANRIGATSEFDGDELRLLETLANQLAVALANLPLLGDLQSSLERIHHQAMHDALTGLPNRVTLTARLGEALGTRTGTGRPGGGSQVGLILLDLDGFKNVNDSLGHAIGDQLLVTVAERIRRSVRSGDTPARLGGDEFAILLDGVRDQAEAVETGQRLLDDLSAPLALEGHTVHVGGSAGVAMWDAGQSEDELVRNADAAMYSAKAAGKGRVAVFEPAMHEAALDRLALETELRAALDEDGSGGVELRYQPIVAANTGRVVALEARAGWRRPGGVTLAGAELLAAAGELGLGPALGAAVLSGACADLARLKAALGDRAPVSVSVDVGEAQLRDDRLAGAVTAALDAGGLRAEHLELEIAERVLDAIDAEGGGGLRPRLEALRAAGVRLVVDDFGAGSGSVALLQRLPVTGLKLDRAVVAAIDASAEGDALARALVRLTQTLELPVVADGVATSGQLDALRAMRCAFVQGPLLSEALSAAELPDFLRAGVRVP